MGTFLFSVLILLLVFFFGLTRTHSYYLVVLLAFLSFHLPPPLSPTHPLSLFSKPQFPSHDFHFFSYDFLFFPTQRWPLHPASLDLCLPSSPTSQLLPWSYLLLSASDWLAVFLSYRVFLLLDSLCSCLFLPSISDLLFVLVLSETEAQAVRGSYQPQ